MKIVENAATVIKLVPSTDTILSVTYTSMRILRNCFKSEKAVKDNMSLFWTLVTVIVLTTHLSLIVVCMLAIVSVILRYRTSVHLSFASPSRIPMGYCRL